MTGRVPAVDRTPQMVLVVSTTEHRRGKRENPADLRVLAVERRRERARRAEVAGELARQVHRAVTAHRDAGDRMPAPAGANAVATLDHGDELAEVVALP